MDKRFLAKVIDAVLSDWPKLDADHRGLLYDDAVKSLLSWKEDIEKQIACSGIDAF